MMSLLPARMRNRNWKRAMTARLDGSNPCAPLPGGGRSQRCFTVAMFGLMGRLAKHDGQVRAAEVNYAARIMRIMGLDAVEQEYAIACFDWGKNPAADVIGHVRAMAAVTEARGALARLFLRIQCRLAFVKGDMRLKDRILLRDVADVLGFSKAEFQALCRELRAEAGRKQFGTGNFLDNAYKVLQLNPDAGDGEIRRAYLRLVSRYHPDKLAQDDPSGASLREAADKLMAVRGAYETLRSSRKSRV